MESSANPSTNVLFEADENGNLTGNIVIRDLDAFKPDLSFVILLGLFWYALVKTRSSIQTSQDGQSRRILQKSYNTYVKHNWSPMLKTYCKLRKSVSAVIRGDLSETFDKMFLLEAVHYRGFRAVFWFSRYETKDKLLWIKNGPRKKTWTIRSKSFSRS